MYRNKLIRIVQTEMATEVEKKKKFSASAYSSDLKMSADYSNW